MNWRSTRTLLGSILVVTGFGCTQLESISQEGMRTLRGDGLKGASSDWSDGMRSESDENSLSGFDQRARDIERNLGY